MPEVLSVTEACQFLKIAKPTLYKHVRSGNIPAYKLGNCYKFHKESLDKWIKDRVEEDTQARIQKSKKK